MHRVIHRESFIFLLVLYIGIFSAVLNADIVEPSVETLQKNGTVFVEPTSVEYTKTGTEYKLKPYRELRHNWGFMFGGGYSTYEPVNYEPNFAKTQYRKVYGQPATGMLEALFQAKRNFSGFSVGAELGVGNLKNEHTDSSYIGSVLNLTEIRLGGTAYLDSLFPERYVVPYISGGGYMMVYKETLGGNGFGGNTTPAFYATGGALFSLDWIDRRAARIAYEESSLLGSYLYVEARKYFLSQVKKDPDFSNLVSFAGGVRVEF
jgi:hypothetical protein